MYDRNKVIQIAKGEVGYLEKSKAAFQRYGVPILYKKTEGAGYDNYTKYGYEMHQIYPAVMDFPAAWCDNFADWCFYKAYGVTTAKSLLDGNFDDYTVNSAQMYKNHNALDHTPEVGAQIFFTKNGAVSGCYHTGIVIAVSADKTVVTTIEGNTSATGGNIEPNGGCVAQKIRAVNNNTLFGHPNYADNYSGSSKPIQTQPHSSSTGRIIRVHDTGADVKEMQRLLIACGYGCGPAGADGIFGTDTFTALCAFQKQVGIAVDGEYGPQSKQRLQAAFKGRNIDTVAKEVIAGKWGNGVERQNRLKSAGYDYKAVQARVDAMLKK